MFVTQFESFVGKFQQLWQAGETAHLNLETHAGQAWVGLRVQVRDFPGPAQQDHYWHHYFAKPSQRSPAYHRRQEKRRAARTTATVEKHQKIESSTEQVNDEIPLDSSEIIAEKATDQNVEKVAVKASPNSEIIDKKDETTSDEVTQPEFTCDLCDFKSNWENGLKIHLARKHTRIEQLDGFIDMEGDNDEKYERTRHYWKEGRLGSGYQTYLDAIDILTNSEFSEESKTSEKGKVFEARKISFGTNLYFPPWDKE